MSLIRVTGLSDLQEDLRWPLLADSFFRDITVIDFHNADLESEVSRALTTLTEKNSKCGAGVVVMPLRATDTFTDASRAHPLRVRITFLVLEVPIINRGATGTGKTALNICERIRQVMKHYEHGGLSSPLVPDDPTFEAVQDPIAPEAWEVRFTCFAGVDQAIYKPARVVIDVDDVTGIATLTCGTPDVTIYYTLDGSFPFTSADAPNAGAMTYSSPITLEGEWVIRAAAYRDDFIPGDVTLARATDLAAMDGEGGSIGGLN